MASIPKASGESNSDHALLLKIYLYSMAPVCGVSNTLAASDASLEAIMCKR